MYYIALDNWHLIYAFLPLIELFLGLNEISYIKVPINAKDSYQLPVTTALPPALQKSGNTTSSIALILKLCKSSKNKNKVNLTSEVLIDSQWSLLS